MPPRLDPACPSAVIDHNRHSSIGDREINLTRVHTDSRASMKTRPVEASPSAQGELIRRADATRIIVIAAVIDLPCPIDHSRQHTRDRADRESSDRGTSRTCNTTEGSAFNSRFAPRRDICEARPRFSWSEARHPTERNGNVNTRAPNVSRSWRREKLKDNPETFALPPGISFRRMLFFAAACFSQRQSRNKGWNFLKCKNNKMERQEYLEADSLFPPGKFGVRRIIVFFNNSGIFKICKYSLDLIFLMTCATRLIRPSAGVITTPLWLSSIIR